MVVVVVIVVVVVVVVVVVFKTERLLQELIHASFMLRFDILFLKTVSFSKVLLFIKNRTILVTNFILLGC
jgi:hypothetical protein